MSCREVGSTSPIVFWNRESSRTPEDRFDPLSPALLRDGAYAPGKTDPPALQKYMTTWDRLFKVTLCFAD